MKRGIIFVLCAIMAAAVLSGCTKSVEMPVEQPMNSESGLRRTTLYYKSKEGYVVPVVKSIPWEEGIGKAALGYLVTNEENDRSIARMGLQTVIPDNTQYTLRISDDGTARLDLIGLGELQNAEDERAMVEAIVNTLGEFEAIDRVRFTVNGKETDALPYGTDISKPITAGIINVEEGEVAVSGKANGIVLYFPNKSASLNIPVTRYVDASPSFTLAVQEIIKGAKDPALLCCFPEGTELLSAVIADGVATVDLSAEFESVKDTEGLLQAAQNSIYLCANEFEDVYGVDIYVEGSEFSLHTAQISAPVYVNELR